MLYIEPSCRYTGGNRADSIINSEGKGGKELMFLRNIIK